MGRLRYRHHVHDTDLYQHLLGLIAPWKVSRLELDVKGQRVDVYAEHSKPKTWDCPECGTACGLHDHDDERTWRHLDSCNFQTILHARVPRVNCPTHGVRQARVPWAEPRSRFTSLFERFAIDVLRETNVAGAANILGLSWDEAQHIMERAVARGVQRRPHEVPRVMGVDEKALAKGQRYATLAYDLEAGHVIGIAEGRSGDSLVACLGRFSLNDLAGVEAVAMDMSAAYVQRVRAIVADADQKIVFDRFHIAAHMNKAVDQVRRGENKVLRLDGDERLVGSQHMWRYAAENLPAKYEDDFAALRASGLKTARAWALKESLRELWGQRSRAAGERWWAAWYSWAVRSRLPPVKKVAAMMKRHLPNILTYFTHRITNAGSEAINSVIQMLKKRAFGYRSFPNFKTAVLFHCGGLSLYPSHPKAG